MVEFRKVERKKLDGTWEEIAFKDLKSGDHFKLYDKEEDEPRYEDGSTVYIATSNPHSEPPEGNYSIGADNAAPLNEMKVIERHKA